MNQQNKCNLFTRDEEATGIITNQQLGNNGMIIRKLNDRVSLENDHHMWIMQQGFPGGQLSLLNDHHIWIMQQGFPGGQLSFLLNDHHMWIMQQGFPGGQLSFLLNDHHTWILNAGTTSLELKMYENSCKWHLLTLQNSWPCTTPILSWF